MIKSYYRIVLLLEAIIVGLGAGVIVSLFRYILEQAGYFRLFVRENFIYIYNEGNLLEVGVYLLLVVLVLAFVATLIARLNRFEPMAAGGGIPQVKGVLLGEMRMRPWRVLGVKLAGALAGLCAGLSLGRQGPSVQFGACVGLGLGEGLGRTRAHSHLLMNAGAGAALAAAFNAPLAGVLFALEELAHGFSGALLLVAFTAAVNATVVSEIVFGAQPIFTLGELPVMELGAGYFLWIALGAFVGLLGFGFNRMLPISQSFYSRLVVRGVPYSLCFLFVLTLALALLFALPEVTGGGDTLVNDVLVRDFTLGFLVLLLVAKFSFTGLCFGTGAPGGLFLPMMSLGAISGAIFARLLGAGDFLPAEFIGTYGESCIVFGMAAYFTAVTKSPVSSVVLIVELTESLEHLLPLLCVTLTALFVADICGGRPIYERLLQGGLRRARGE